MTGRNRSAHLWALLIILVLGFGLRLLRLGAQSLWYDETVSTYLAGESVPAMVAHTAGDIHPPGYYLLLHCWLWMAGSSDMAAAFFSAWFGALLIVLAYWFAVRAFGRGAGLATALLVAFSPFNLWYSQEVRMYTLGAALGMALLATLAPSLLSRTAAVPSWARLGVYALLAAAGLWVLYYFVFLLAALNLIVLVWWVVGRLRRRLSWLWLGRWIIAQGAVALLYSPWLSVVWRQATSPPVPPWRGFTPLGRVIVETWSALGLGQSISVAQVWPVLILFLLLFLAGLLPWSRSEAQSAAHPSPAKWNTGAPACPGWLAAGYVFLPVLLIYLASLATPLFHVRYTFTFSTPFYAVIGAGLARVWRLWRPALWMALGVILAASGWSVYAYHTDPSFAADDHRSAVAFLSSQWRPGDAILIDAGYVYTAVLDYWRGDAIGWRGRLVASGAEVAGGVPALFEAGTVDGSPTLGWNDPDSDFYAMSWAETEQALVRLFAGYDRVWLYRCYDTVTDPQGAIRRWLDRTGVLFEDQVFTGESQLRIQGYLTRRDPLGAGTTAVSERLANGSLQLAGFRLRQSEIAVGSSLDLDLTWRVDSPLSDDSVLLAGLFDAEGRRWAQVDVRPMGSKLPVSAWPTGGLVRTPLRILVPPTTPPGQYRVEAGWYHFVDGRPTWLPWTSGDRLLLGRVVVSAPGDWWALAPPSVQVYSGISIGQGLRLLGVSAGQLTAYPGDELQIELVWQATAAAATPVVPLLHLVDDGGQILGESGPAPGTPALDSLAPGQAVRDFRVLAVPPGLRPGAYSVRLVASTPEGARLPIRRGWLALGSSYPIVTVLVPQRAAATVAPPVQFHADIRFGNGIRLIGYDLAWREQTDGGQAADLNLCWQALEPMAARYKIFVHLVPYGVAADIRAQADLYPRIPTSAWQTGEFLCERLGLHASGDLPEGRYELLVGWYEETTGERLPAYTGDGKALGDSLELQEIQIDGTLAPVPAPAQ